MKVLAGEIAIAASSAVAEEMLFESIKAKVRHQLDFLADEPDFIQMFACNTILGASEQTYSPKLLRYLEVFWKRARDGCARRRSLCPTSSVAPRVSNFRGQGSP